MNRKEFIALMGTGMIGGAAVLSGCSGLLNQDNPNTLTPNSFWKTSDDAIAGLTAVYNVFTGQRYAAVGNWSFRLAPTMYRGDDIGITHDVAALWSLAMFTLTATNNTAEGAWSHTYTGIYRANQVVNNVPNISMDHNLKNRLIGEAKFLRAYFYFLLLTNFNNIPLILNTPKVSNNFSVAQSPPDEIWDQIEKDLKDAAEVLPATYDASDKGRVTKGAALGYLGKSYLYRQKWSNAASIFEQIINSQNYELVPEFKNIFPESNEFNEETLLEINYSGKTINGVNNYSRRNKEEALAEAGGWYECYPNQWLFNQMTKEKTTSGKLDPRVYYTILWNGSGMKYYGQSYEDLVGPNATKMGWMKYSQAAELDHKITDYTGANDRLLRYADILLMHAEAVVQSGGSLSDAKKSINKVRSRAHLGNLPPTMIKKDVLREIEHQRVCELADEGNRWHDLLRWNGSIDGSMTIKENLMQHGAIGAKNFDPSKHKYLPIPLSEINTNTMIKQNPGY